MSFSGNEHQVANSMLKRNCPGYDPSVDGSPQCIYECFESRSGLFFPKVSKGYFFLTSSALSFLIDYPYTTNRIGHQYSYANTQIKDITSVCANYQVCNDKKAFIVGLILSIFSIVALFRDWFFTLFSVFLLATGVMLIVGAYTFLRIRLYKICIGTVQGGITIMGGTRVTMSTKAVWTQPNTIVYNARPLDNNLIDFIEEINWRINSLQERGEYAFTKE